MMTLSKLCPRALPLLALLALLATSGAALAQPFTAALFGPRMAQQRATELPQPVVEKPSLAKSGHGDDEAWFYFGEDDEEDDDGGDDDDDDDRARGLQVNCALIADEAAQRDCKARRGQSSTPPANGLFTPGTAPQAKSN